MITASQLLAHAVGDYLLQSDWMANEKTKKTWVAFVHAFFYTLPFLFLTLSCKALLVILTTHALIDRFRLARYVCWVKNFISPEYTNTGSGLIYWWHPWPHCKATGYHQDRPAFLAVWLLIITDNVIHVLINAAALRWLT